MRISLAAAASIPTNEEKNKKVLEKGNLEQCEKRFRINHPLPNKLRSGYGKGRNGEGFSSSTLAATALP